MAVALLLAAGRGERLGSERPKAFVEVGGRPLVWWSLDVLARSPSIERIVLATPVGLDVQRQGLQLPENAICIVGGAVRSASVRRALQAADGGDPVLVHDAARPLLSVALVERTLTALHADGVDAAIAAAPVTDTIKRAMGEPPIVTGTLDRSDLWAVQTPQVFRRDALERALDVPEEVLARATDDAWLIERSGGRVTIVPSSAENMKLTTAADVALAELLLARRTAQPDASDPLGHARDLQGTQGPHAD